MTTPDATAPLLKISNIETLYFDRIYALHGLSLQVKEKEIFAVLGPNGAGKTTLLKTVAGLIKDQPKKGVIEFAGRRIHRLAPERVASAGIVYVPEDGAFFGNSRYEKTWNWAVGDVRTKELRKTWILSMASSPS